MGVCVGVCGWLGSCSCCVSLHFPPFCFSCIFVLFLFLFFEICVSDFFVIFPDVNVHFFAIFLFFLISSFSFLSFSCFVILVVMFFFFFANCFHDFFFGGDFFVCFIFVMAIAIAIQIAIAMAFQIAVAILIAIAMAQPEKWQPTTRQISFLVR